ncbi:16S rRNA (cytosine(967)-C(5))-methyltransferase RsmB [Paenibacillus turpanensis]|uniref:16S rRNA (cytosine(967)-C(5))-methyltransferase RsmB n=1 Tax=Paenibacillus turpanensis TaxID=2689078 RepID=UPI00140A7F45|nr:16S rRNA (cytosine(967)-C(5))-methyltransferase RsmB [Paenibacillus turpanensis]
MNKSRGRSRSQPSVRTARELALELLLRVEQEGSYSNLLLHRLLEKHPLDRQETGLATEIAYGTIQRLNTIDYFLNRFVAKGVAKLEPWVRALFRLSFYQLYYLDRVPDHAVVNEAVRIAKERGHQGISGLVNAVLRNVIRQRAELVVPSSLPAAERIALEHSHPEWLVRRWVERYGEETAAEMCRANNIPPRTSVRVNRLKFDRAALLDKLAELGITAERSAVSEDGVVFAEGSGNAALTEGYRQGWYTIQDESSMLVARLVAPEPGMAVLDCCAAPGGKTTHLAERMEDRGELYASDIHPHKRKLIEEQAQRLGFECIRTMVSDARELSAKFEANRFDRILLDAPCSGLGVIRRKPDMKWTKKEADITDICSVQDEILQRIHGLLKPGGVLVYSTCTTEPEENERRIREFLQEHPDFALDDISPYLPADVLAAAGCEPGSGMLQILPHHTHSDGFFMARLKRLK